MAYKYEPQNVGLSTYKMQLRWLFGEKGVWQEKSFCPFCHIEVFIVCHHAASKVG